MTTMPDMITQAQIWNEARKHVERENMGIAVISHERRPASFMNDLIPRP